MWRDILKYGAIAGLVVAAVMIVGFWSAGGDMPHGWLGMAIGYATMLLALSAVFMGIKHHRDVAGGGVIRFWPAFGMGLGISFVAALFYVAAWELVQATARVCAMTLMLHGIGSEKSVPVKVADALSAALGQPAPAPQRPRAGPGTSPGRRLLVRGRGRRGHDASGRFGH